MSMDSRRDDIQGGRLDRALVTAGHLLTLVGALDPLEGSLLVLPGCVLVAVAAWRLSLPRRVRHYRVVVALLAVFGVSALWLISGAGGIGGRGGLPLTWALLSLPYPVALVASFSGPAAPPWVPWSGCAVGAIYLALAAFILWRPRLHSGLDVVALLAALGLAIVVACTARIRQRRRGATSG